MDLFNPPITENTNLLPKDGIVNYYGPLLSRKEGDHYLDRLLSTIAWRHDEAFIYGKHIVTKRKVAWYGDESYDYTYSNTTKQALPWTQELLELKELIEKRSGHKFNSCLLNLYHNGDEAMAWHSDDEKALGKNTAITSFSLGAERTFAFRHKKTKETVSLMLQHGSLLIMKGATQTNWLHRLTKSKKIKRPRVSLTFRTIVA